MNYKHLYYFWWVAKMGGVVKAGEQLHITPHTISGQIGILEDDLGTPLFTKRGRNIELNDAGKLAFGYANDIFALGSELEESVRNYQAGGASNRVPCWRGRRGAEGHRLPPDRTGDTPARAGAHRLP